MALFGPSTPQYGSYTNTNNKSLTSRILMVVIFGLIGVVVITVGLVLVNTISSGPKNDFMQLTANEDSLYGFVIDHAAQIQNSDLRKIDADARILLASSSVYLHSALNRDYGVATLPDNLIASESDPTSAQKLKQAALINKTDSTYRSIMVDKITALTALAQSVRREVSTPKTVQTVDQLTTDLQTLNQELTALSL